MASKSCLTSSFSPWLANFWLTLTLFKVKALFSLCCFQLILRSLIKIYARRKRKHSRRRHHRCRLLWQTRRRQCHKQLPVASCQFGLAPFLAILFGYAGGIPKDQHRASTIVTQNCKCLKRQPQRNKNWKCWHAHTAHTTIYIYDSCHRSLSLSQSAPLSLSLYVPLCAPVFINARLSISIIELKGLFMTAL